MLKTLMRIVVLLSISHVVCVCGDIQVRITSKGLNYAKDVLVRQLQKFPNDLLPAQIKGEDYGVQWSLQNIQYKNVEVVKSELSVFSKTLILKQTNVESSMDGLFSQDNVTTKINSINITSMFLKVSLGHGGPNRDGKPVIGMNICECTVKDLAIGFAGGSYELFKAWTSVYKFTTKRMISKQVCNSLGKFLTLMNDRLQNMTFWQGNSGPIIYDFRLSSPITTTNSYMQSWYLLRYTTNTNAKYQFTPERMPDIQETGAMFYVKVSEQVLKSLLFAMHEVRPLQEPRYKTKLSDRYINLLKDVLNTDQREDDVALREMYVKVTARRVPDVDFTSEGINVTFYGEWEVSLAETFLIRDFNATFVIVAEIRNHTLYTKKLDNRMEFGDYTTNLAYSDVQLLSEEFQPEYWLTWWGNNTESHRIETLPFTIVNTKFIFQEGFLTLATEISIP